MKTPCIILATAIAATLRAAVPVAWTNSPGMPPYPVKPVPHGVPVDFRVTLKGYTSPLIAPGADLHLWYQTNGMGRLWWPAPAALEGDTIAASFGPAQDVGADRVSLFFGAPSNVFASAVLRLTHSPGFAPASLPLPVPVLDFAAVDLVNVAALTNGWSFGSSADLTDATNYTNQVAAEFEDGTRGAMYAYYLVGGTDWSAETITEFSDYVSTNIYTKAETDAKISTNNAAFVAAVLAAPLAGASASDIAEIAEYGGYGTVGAALLALIAGLAALKRRVRTTETAVAGKADAFKLTSPRYDEHGFAQLADGAANDIRLEYVERLSDDWLVTSGGEYLTGIDYEVGYDSSTDQVDITIRDGEGDSYTNWTYADGEEVALWLGRDNAMMPFTRHVEPYNAYSADTDRYVFDFQDPDTGTHLFSVTAERIMTGTVFTWGGATFEFTVDEGEITGDASTWYEVTISSLDAKVTVSRDTRHEQNYTSLSIPPSVSGRSRHFVVRIDATSMMETAMLQVDLRGASTDGDAITMPADGAYVVMRFTETSANVLTVEQVYPRVSGGGGVTENPVYYGGNPNIDMDAPQRTSDVVGTHSSDIDLDMYEGSITITGGLGSDGYTGTLVGDGMGWIDEHDTEVYGYTYDASEGIVEISNDMEGWSHYVYIG